MGRLSDARKKAKQKKGQPETNAAAPVATPDSAEAPPASTPGAPDAGLLVASQELAISSQIDSTAADALVDEILAGSLPSEEPDRKESVLPSSGLAEDLLREWEENKPAKLQLPSSGLAEDLLDSEKFPQRGEGGVQQDAEEMWPDELIASGTGAKPLLGSSGLAEDILGSNTESETSALANDVLGVLRDEPQEFRRVALPSSGLADEILQMVDKPVGRSGLALDEIHQFESFFEEEQADEMLQLVLFQMEGELFALEIDRVQEIIRVPMITRVPHVARHVRGVCNLRGRIVPVLELRLLMRLATRTVDRDSRVMVLDLAGKQIGVLVDRASEVVHVKVGDVEPPPEEMRLIDKNLVTAVARLGERIIFILDVDRVLSLK
jgi:purine-binding chemotaxis protein CheW